MESNLGCLSSMSPHKFAQEANDSYASPSDWPSLAAVHIQRWIAPPQAEALSSAARMMDALRPKRVLHGRGGD
ncbi:uncharacterized protein N7459_007757 [Penicillium hispanicum]|uniref:uncharacterized protein n=1 Tax=Penicillium hispanicum TaxID=1080232 RepID=UPI002540EC8C|nr:uncharacterized protein N7459_007757 [Penicillium hispanicum]KAJ5578793.1 hypothetical protein N7459_007757 [Penicillium hispanicum]